MTLDNELATRARRGEPAAATTLLTRIRPGLLRYCWAHLDPTDQARAHELTDNICLAVFETLPRRRDRALPFTALVYRVAATTLAAHRRDTAPAREIDAGVGDPDPARRLAQLLDDLTPTQREILVLRVAAGLTVEETSAVLDRTPTQVRLDQSAALTRLRAQSRAPVAGEVTA